MNVRGYYFITDSGYSEQGVVNDIAVALDCGVQIVQYRDKNKSTRERLREAEKAVQLCRRYGALLIVNDSVEIAGAIGADGVNVGANDLPPELAFRILGAGAIVGVSVSTLADVEEAVRAGATYLGAGPIAATPTKKDAAAPTGLGLLAEIKRRTPVPVAAIGGITFENAAEVLAAGADLICSISAVYRAPSLKEGIRKMMMLYADYGQEEKR